MIDIQTGKDGKRSEVTFSLEPGLEAEHVSVVGDFNDWDPEVTPMKRRKDGSWRAKVSLEAGRDYAFRYLVDDDIWLNDDACDCCTNPYGGEDSLLHVHQDLPEAHHA